MIKCGNCRRHHDTAADVKACYERSSERGAAEIHGRRQVKGDGATELTATFLRRTQTPSELALWSRLRSGFEGHRFKPQVRLHGYVVDFFCPLLSLAVEIDGGSHRGKVRLDGYREDILRANHIHVVRIADDVVLEHIDRALDILSVEVRKRASQLQRPVAAPIAPLKREPCAHQDDKLLCQKCKLIDQELRRREADSDPDDQRVPQRPPPSSPSRYSETPGLVNRPPEPPGTISRRGY